MYRQAAVAGTFYPADADSVNAFISKHELDVIKEEATCVLVPHAGYIYSGATAVHTLSSINIPNLVILIGPNHTGTGPSVSVFPGGEWQTPLGYVFHDSDTIEKICKHPLFTKDASAHREEHSLEVIFPMLKYFNPDVKVVCITSKYLHIDEIKEAAQHLVACIDDALVLISSDFNHFEDVSTTELKDKAAIDKLLALDSIGLYETVSEMKISMCGVVPACIGVEYSKAKGALEPIVVEHTHSGLVNGDNNRVVGYCGLYYK
ncbi:MAG: AmmeMemoRadiSam system protein B [Denitrovibrio sp.]|nr:MAG: AmmeMemoRadiSam system protein B [Denitrovibrio sp.]